MLPADAEPQIPLRFSMGGRICVGRERTCCPTLVAPDDDGAPAVRMYERKPDVCAEWAQSKVRVHHRLSSFFLIRSCQDFGILSKLATRAALSTGGRGDLASSLRIAR